MTEERYGYSRMTGTWYLLHDWEDKGDGKVVAKGKTEVDREDVPQKWLDATDETTYEEAATEEDSDHE